LYLSQSSATAIIFSAAVLGMLWALLQFLIITRIPVRSEGVSDSTGLVSGSNDEATTRRLVEIYTAIYEGAESFLRAEYSICARFIFVFGILIFVLVSWGTGWDFARGLFTTLSFVLGAATSIREYCFPRFPLVSFHFLNGLSQLTNIPSCRSPPHQQCLVTLV
jgi:Na+/H+-translocating membrane pyrophosphatase